MQRLSKPKRIKSKMDYSYSRYNIQGKEQALARALEILPGALSWSIIIGMLVVSIIKPLIAAVIMIAFVLYWVLRLLYMNIFLILSYLRLTIEKDTDWMERIAGIDRIDDYLKGLCNARLHKGIKDKISSRIHCGELTHLAKSGLTPPRSRDIYHLVIIPVINETKDVIEPGIKGIISGKYPSQRIFALIALEARASEEVSRDAALIRDAYKNNFFDFIVVTHPSDIPGEARVKGANTSCAARYAKEYLDKKGIPYENVIVSCFDADTVANPDYFSCLTYHFMMTTDRTRSSYQPVPVYHNNIWNVPGFARIIDIGTSFFELIEATDPVNMVTFSSHSMSFKALVDIGFWPVDMISDDSAIFWKAFIHYDGNYHTTPIYTTVSMDIAAGKNSVKTFVNIYKQKRRWAWGVENFPIVARAFLKSKSISFYKKITYGYRLLEAFISWATWSMLLSLVSWLPGLFAHREFANSTVYYIAPRIQTTIFGLASFGLVICVVLSILMLPKRKTKSILKRIQHVFEWLFIPVIILILSAIPALDAQTRLMLGRYMEFGATDKYRKK
ncbi:MAG: glycosyltransferase family 2 protein [Candidatus Omnitrophica bacterium]|nr:glycosyltransferase family 2 protein [Candidatus Omnitrophota bacterium]